MSKEKKCAWRFKDGKQCPEKALEHSNYCEKHYKFWEDSMDTGRESDDDEGKGFRSSNVFYDDDISSDD